jgi:hypothetical protein
MGQAPGFNRRRIEQSTKTKRPFKLGDPLEYRVARLFIHMGYWVRRGREIYTVGRLDTATDLDVLAVRYTDLFRRDVQIAECKGGGNGPLDRVFWLSGVKQYVEATRATLVRPVTKWNIKDFAAEAGLEILDLPHIEGLERAWGIEPSLWLGVSDREFFEAVEDEWNHAIVGDSVIRELYQTLAGEIRFHEPFAGINFLLHHLRALSRGLSERRYSSESFTRFLLAESTSQLSMFLMRIAEVSLGLSDRDRGGFVRKGLTYGHMDKRAIDRIFRNAKQITEEMVKHHTGRNIRVDETFFKMPEPPTIDGVQGIVRLLVGRPHMAATLPAITDLLLFERFVKQRDGVEWLNKVFTHVDIRERISSVQEYLKILHSMGAVPDALLGTKKPAQLDRAAAETPVALALSHGEPDADAGVSPSPGSPSAKTSSATSSNEKSATPNSATLFPKSDVSK